MPKVLQSLSHHCMYSCQSFGYDSVYLVVHLTTRHFLQSLRNFYVAIIDLIALEQFSALMKDLTAPEHFCCSKFLPATYPTKVHWPQQLKQSTRHFQPNRINENDQTETHRSLSRANMIEIQTNLNVTFVNRLISHIEFIINTYKHNQT